MLTLLKHMEISFGHGWVLAGLCSLMYPHSWLLWPALVCMADVCSTDTAKSSAVPGLLSQSRILKSKAGRWAEKYESF